MLLKATVLLLNENGGREEKLGGNIFFSYFCSGSIMNISLYIASRLQLKPTDGSRSPGVVIAVTGMAVAVAVMMMTLAVVTGFKDSITEKVLGFDSELTVTAVPTTNEYGYTDPASTLFRADSTLLETVAGTLGGDVKLRRVLTATSILKTDSAFLGLTLLGWQPGDGHEFLSRHIVEGVMPDYSADSTRNQAVISRTAARELSLAVGDKVYAYFFTDGNLRARRVEVAGIFDTMFGERDRLLAVCSKSLLERVYDVDSLTVSQLMIDSVGLARVPDASEELQAQLVKRYYLSELPALQLSTVFTSGAVYFSWLELLDTNVWVIIILMTLVASSTLVSSLFILILERVRTIGLLKSLGATNRQVRRVFLFLAMKIVMWGMVIGNVVAVGVILLQSQFHILPLDPESYYLNYVPMEFNPWHLVAVDAATILISWLVMVFPSMIIATISPSRTMRYE